MKTVYDLQEQLLTRFKTLNEFSGITYLTDDNVSYPNKLFSIPDDNRFFVVSFMNNEPIAAANFDEAEDNYSGIMQIDICTPLDNGEDESRAKFEWLSKLFPRGATFDDIEIKSTPSMTVDVQNEYYRTIVRIAWESYIDKE